MACTHIHSTQRVKGRDYKVTHEVLMALQGSETWLPGYDLQRCSILFSWKKKQLSWTNVIKIKQEMNQSTLHLKGVGERILHTVQWISLQASLSRLFWKCRVTTRLAYLGVKHPAQQPSTISHPFPLYCTLLLSRRCVAPYREATTVLNNAQGLI